MESCGLNHILRAMICGPKSSQHNLCPSSHHHWRIDQWLPIWFRSIKREMRPIVNNYTKGFVAQLERQYPPTFWVSAVILIIVWNPQVYPGGDPGFESRQSHIPNCFEPQGLTMFGLKNPPKTHNFFWLCGPVGKAIPSYFLDECSLFEHLFKSIPRWRSRVRISAKSHSFNQIWSLDFNQKQNKTIFDLVAQWKGVALRFHINPFKYPQCHYTSLNMCVMMVVIWMCNCYQRGGDPGFDSRRGHYINTFLALCFSRTISPFLLFCLMEKCESNRVHNSAKPHNPFRNNPLSRIAFRYVAFLHNPHHLMAF